MSEEERHRGLHTTPLRLESFSDAVFAILITIMVLELRPPAGIMLADLYPILPIFLSYVLSFVYLMTYWNNHHQLLRAVHTLKGGVMWANAHLLFWLSLIPFATAWLGQSNGAFAPTLLYGFSLLFPALAYFILQRSIIATEGEDSLVAKALGSDFKGKISPVLYVAGIVATFITPLLSYFFFVVVALMWIVPDQRLERAIGRK
jgi:uncharacterized membrane protein